MAAPAPFVLMYLPGRLIAPGNAALTARNILGSQMLVRLGIVGDLIVAVVFVLLVMALHRLLRGVSEHQAWLMVGLVLVSVAVTSVNVVIWIMLWLLIRGARVQASAAPAPDRSVQVKSEEPS